MEAGGGRGEVVDEEYGRQLRERPQLTWKTAVVYGIGRVFSKLYNNILISRHCCFPGLFVVTLVVDIYGFEAVVGGLLAGESLARQALNKLGGRHDGKEDRFLYFK